MSYEPTEWKAGDKITATKSKEAYLGSTKAQAVYLGNTKIL